MHVRPLPSTHGVGMTSEELLPPEIGRGFHYEKVGRHHNYYATPLGWRWPEGEFNPPTRVIDGFSPNLNKDLHVGHLRNLAVAKSLKSFLYPPTSRFVALFGASLGVKKKALEGLEYWLNFVEYTPERYFDLLMPFDVIETREPTPEEVESGKIKLEADYEIPGIWDGPDGPLVVVRADGRPLYAYYDLVFAREVGPTHYITGAEQREHFASLGLGDKHLVLGLVCGQDGKKIKSRSGDALSAVDAIDLVASKLDPTDEPKKVAWNVLAWNFLQCKRDQNIKFDPNVWTRPDSPGMYITYTYARCLSALSKTQFAGKNRNICRRTLEDSGLLEEQVDVELAALSSQLYYWHEMASQKLDPSPIAHYAHDLARKMGNLYHKESIVGGRESFILAMQYANETLSLAMHDLGMFTITRV